MVNSHLTWGASSYQQHFILAEPLPSLPRGFIFTLHASDVCFDARRGQCWRRHWWGRWGHAQNTVLSLAFCQHYSGTLRVDGLALVRSRTHFFGAVFYSGPQYVQYVDGWRCRLQTRVLAISWCFCLARGFELRQPQGKSPVVHQNQGAKGVVRLTCKLARCSARQRLHLHEGKGELRTQKRLRQPKNELLLWLWHR